MGGKESMPPKTEFDSPWRDQNWDKQERDTMVAALRNFKLSDPDMGQLRCLLYGPVGAGKSSFVNSVNNVFQGRVAHNALVAAASGTSFTKTYNTRYIKDGDKRLPFAFNDVMGLEAQEKGMQPEDIINALKGHLPEGYKFNPCSALTDESAEYNKKPRSSDKVHCLVSVVAADKISLMSNDVIVKMRKVREKASELGIPQVDVMTMPDKACPLVKMDVKKMYTSKAIKDKMLICSNELGVPMNCILPVKNYHEEGMLDNDMDILILNAMTQIMNFANDYIWNLQQGKENGGCHVCCI
ncbi:interferon-induced protein 44-like [Salmo salar]|uniref:Interferon-induced protein 44-like n=1 Tax=Salmo salar TaxID=8030 RepID=A0A1S3P630_SALSA|nr:interferon-induced protein 44-like [Salmo salar]XP_014023057.2 interferon-induced protein 44-like [Salmo salar]